MSTQAIPVGPAPAGAAVPWALLGRPFVRPLVDLGFVGGLFGLAVGAFAYARGFRFDAERFWVVVLGASDAHFAASTVRLYARPGSVRRWPFLALGVPVLTLAVTSALLFADRATWRLVEGFYVTWSTYHYAAQTFGLAIMYAYRSECRLTAGDRRLMRFACLLPFVYGLLGPHSGPSSLVPEAVYTQAIVLGARTTIRTVLLPLLLLAPAFVFLRLRLRGLRLPIISVVIMLTNAIFWTFFLDREAFAWAALTHALQYLVVVTVFHVEDTMATPRNTHGRLYHALGFYAACLALGYVLFDLWPQLYAFFWINLDRPSTGRHIAFMINLHHFLVDGYIWKLRDKNLTQVVGGGGGPVAATP